MLRRTLIAAGLLCALCCAQDTSNPVPPPQTSPANRNGTIDTVARHPRWLAQEPPSLSTWREHWDLFCKETASPLTAAGSSFNGVFAQITNSDPKYGSNAPAFGKRVAASAADIASQNFFGDFLVASALHEDPRYIRRGKEYGFWYRFGYAISRAVVIRTSSSGHTFNWDNFVGSAATTGLSNLYYPAASRTRGAMLLEFGTKVADNGLINLAPEFWPDFRRKILRRSH